jgi:hypothetical protein
VYHFSLEIEGGGGDGEISKPKALRDIIEAYYKQLFGKEERGQINLQSDIWENEDSMLELGNRQFDRVFFFEKETKETLVEMKPNTALRPGGFTSEFL